MNETALENKWVEVGDVIASSHRISKFNDFLFSLFHFFMYYKEEQEFSCNCYLQLQN